MIDNAGIYGNHVLSQGWLEHMVGKSLTDATMHMLAGLAMCRKIQEHGACLT